MRVGADEDLAGPGETFEVDVVRDAVSGAGVVDAVARRERLQEAVLVHVLVVDLQHVVVDVHNRERDVDTLYLQSLELECGHGPGCVLDQDLVHGQVYLLAGDEVPGRQVTGEQFLDEVPRLCHALSLLPCASKAIIEAAALPGRPRPVYPPTRGP